MESDKVSYSYGMKMFHSSHNQSRDVHISFTSNVRDGETEADAYQRVKGFVLDAMDGEQKTIKSVSPAPPVESVGVTEGSAGEFKVSFGKFTGMLIKDIDPNQLQSYIEFIKSKGEIKHAKVKAFISCGQKHLSTLPKADDELPF